MAILSLYSISDRLKFEFTVTVITCKIEYSDKYRYIRYPTVLKPLKFEFTVTVITCKIEYSDKIAIIR